MFVLTAFFLSAGKHMKAALEDATVTNGSLDRTQGQHDIVNAQYTLFTPKNIPTEPQRTRSTSMAQDPLQSPIFGYL